MISPVYGDTEVIVSRDILLRESIVSNKTKIDRLGVPDINEAFKNREKV